MDADHSEREQSQDLSDQRESLIERISVLRRTQESVYPSPLAASGGQGNSLAENLERQIRRRHTQLSNLEHSRAAAEVSVIRHTSTPHEQSREDLNIVGENISGIQAPNQNPDPVPQPRPFQIYLDNPEQFHQPRIRLVSTESSSVFSENMSDDGVNNGRGPGDPGAGLGAHQVPETHEFGADGVKAELNTKLFEFHTIKEVYSPNTYDADILLDNKAEWTAEVKSAYMSVMKCVSSSMTKPETNPADRVVLNAALTAAKTEFTSFLTDFTRKCAVNNGGAPGAPAPQVPQPGQQVQPPIFCSQNSSGSNDNSVQAQAAEKARLANIEVDVTAEKVGDIARSLSSEVRRFTDCSLAPNHQIEEAMRKISDWEKKLNILKEQYWDIKTKTQCHGLNTSRLSQAEATVNTVVAEAEVAIENLRHEDSTRCLYSLSQSQAAAVKYTTFGGTDKEDYLKWEKEMKSAFIQNRVRLEDQMKILRENLKGHPLKLIPSSVTDIETAYVTLSGIYGEASKVMSAKKDKLFSMGQLPPEAKTRSAQHIRNQHEWLLTVENLFEEMFDIADKSEDLNRAFINPDCLKEILDLFPIKVSSHLSKVQGTLQTKYESLFTWISDKRKELHDLLKLVGSKSDNQKQPEKVRGGGGQAHATFKPAQRHEDCRICQKLDSEGSTEDLYDGHTNDVASGCPVFVAMSTDQRLKYAKRARLCIYCLDSKYVYRGPGSRHVNCVAFQKKCFFTWVIKAHMGHQHHCCDICSTSFKTVFSLREHMKSFHNKTNGTLLKCDHCDFSGLNKRHLQKHITKHHKKSFKCKDCEFVTVNEHELRSHITKDHKRVKDVTCKYWMNGNCRNSQCLFKHERSRCRYGNNCRKSFCKFDHPATAQAPSNSWNMNPQNMNPWSHPASVSQSLYNEQFPFLGQSRAQHQWHQWQSQSRYRGF